MKRWRFFPLESIRSVGILEPPRGKPTCAEFLTPAEAKARREALTRGAA